MLKTMTVETSTWSTPIITVKRTLKDGLFICIINGRKSGPYKDLKIIWSDYAKALGVN